MRRQVEQVGRPRSSVHRDRRPDRPREPRGNRDSERPDGRFERSVSLLQSVVSDDIRAQFTNGVLTVVLPTTDEAKPRRIQIGIHNLGQDLDLETRSAAR